MSSSETAFPVLGQKRPLAAAAPDLLDNVTSLSLHLLEAAAAGDIHTVRSSIAGGAHAGFQESERGISPLMAAARAGHVPIVRCLLEAGAPWNALDRSGRCAGDHAMEAMSEVEESQQAKEEDQGEGGNSSLADGGLKDCFDVLLNAGIQAELILGASERHTASSGARNAQYLQERLEFGEGRILDADKSAVMMQWERALMESHAQAICQQGGDILNIGFGMGLVDTAIESRGVRSQTIVEAHPDVLRRMEEGGWMNKPNVRVVQGRWQDVMHQLHTYDGVFFDTFGEHYEDLREFHSHLGKLLKKDGVYSFFNGMCAHSPFFHTVYCQLVALELAHLGLKTDFVPLPVAQCLTSEVWEGVKRRYWQLDTYYLPLCYWDEGQSMEEGI